MGDTESCNSGILNSGWNHRCPKQRQKVGVYNEVLCRLKELNVPEAVVPGFEDDLWAHFYRLPARHTKSSYALDMNVERAEEVLMHKRLLDIAGGPTTAIGPAIEVRLVQVRSASASTGGSSKSLLLNSQSKVCSEDSGIPGSMRHLPSSTCLRPMHEITISTNDKPKLLSQLTSLLSETGLDILEAHAFSTTDGYSLDVFVVGGWPIEQHQLKENGSLPTSTTAKQEQTEMNFIWRIDAGRLRYEKKIASGPLTDLYKGTFCNQDVAIKVLKHENLNENIQREFAQEVYILSKIQHKNVVKFVGACTKPPNLYLVTEYMPGGSMFDFLHKQKTALALPCLLKVAIDVSEGMKYLHQNNIIHRDLKAANLLIDENGLPYEHLSPLQAAVGVIQKGLRPKIPSHSHSKLVELLHWCWHHDSSLRPNFSEILEFLLRVTKTVTGECEG
ncbi:Serine/threonine-protein kinase [Vigna angularis]|uniref:non-specific serine/threonine protein kinase n=1 Tax=Phaseolus angularis TaxID=3914 RepID=A0A8T0KM37_PHAAN|nr:Serine/threonine-protein kinase [Vigna angularis]